MSTVQHLIFCHARLFRPRAALSWLVISQHQRAIDCGIRGS